MATKKNGGGAVAKTKKNEVVAYDYGDYQGAGYEGTSQEDFAIPYLNLLQAMSPECGAEGDDQKVEGASPGMLMDSVSQTLYDPKKGVVFVPVATQHMFVEWRPRESGGGIVARHAIDAELVKTCKAEGEFGDYKTPEGNDLIETFYMFGYLLDDADSAEPGQPVVVSFWSTKIKVYKRIMQTLRTFKGRPPIFANRLLIQSAAEKNNQGNFFNYKIAPVNGGVGESLIPPTLDNEPHPLLAFGKMLCDQVRSGERRAADESMEGAGASGTTNPTGGLF